MDHAQILALIATLSGSPDAEAFAGLKAASLQPARAITLQACPRPLPVHEIEGRTILCGTVGVPEDADKPNGRMLPLSFAILKATSRFPEPDPVVYLQGGPGGSALTIIPLLERAFRPWRERRDIVTFDQRSAGISGASVNCTAAMSGNLTAIAGGGGPDSGHLPGTALIKQCLDELAQRGVPLALYNTTRNALDVPRVVAALGYRDYNLLGISYGTKLALEVMRVAPQGIRSVLIDGVAPSWVRLYNAFAYKGEEVIQHVVDQCAADKACNAAYPQLGRIVVETLDKAAKGEIRFRGETVSVDTVLAPFMARNGNYDEASITRSIPAFVYELWRGREMPTVAALIDAKFKAAKPGDAEVLAAAAKLNGEQNGLVLQMLDGVAIRSRADQGIARAVGALRDSVESARGFGPLARTFDTELGRAMAETLSGDKARLQAALGDYVAMQAATPGKPLLAKFVATHFSGPARDRLSALVEAMNAAEIEGSFAIIRRDSYAGLSPFLSGLYLDIYACQEDRPFNSLEGYRTLTASLRYPHLGAATEATARAFFESCTAFPMQPRDNWHVPVASDIPTLSLGGLYDIQTPASWARAAIEKLSNAQAFLIPEAGHGALIYQPCAAQMGVAFIDNPKRKFDNSCAESIRIDWHIAPWVQPAKP
ncbi:alpha/beta hydrolase [Prosthecodimorpha staleyi]|uniref:Proline iminopeptidase n=1 Tax=Prosthecodimorpha staleyi TaxID=2840188 RepID=A0A947D5J4_9HYPH|nr:alpha/beta hydrolase [Prosthecodimorpha staleyi]MBT9291130.1 alpha/beta hydrolase [Prosthecodimorpha staleyi]